MPAARRANWPWVSIAVTTSCVMLAAMPESLIEPLSGNRHAILHGELWRLWSAHLTHFSPRHALIDSAALLVNGTMAESIFGSHRVAQFVLIGAPLISSGIVLVSPDLLDYRGASAIAIMLATMVGLSLWQSRPSTRLTLSILAACLFAKIGFDAIGLSLTLTDLPNQVHVAWQAHLLAIAIGAGWYFLQKPGAMEITAPV
ncbi:rhomboid family intramembrane serine protease [Pseudolysobacter antarcticus]|uniref:Rhomboid family intramembrane serine protease n=1 Tax=Pseudolysobacter antarcticus TaxID=2511995 RepID=A0A411HMQ6_9GAMM|nr:rhomboid family intramembrane serine protease [Pseudolysobacter antarcticus]QBB71763.1 rhomboid family intramembrane serine protease [Pseudolysobacter antarcticus]